MKFLVLDEADDLQKKDDRKEHPFFVHFPGPFLGVLERETNGCFSIFT